MLYLVAPDQAAQTSAIGLYALGSQMRGAGYMVCHVVARLKVSRLENDKLF